MIDHRFCPFGTGWMPSLILSRLLDLILAYHLHLTSCHFTPIILRQFVLHDLNQKVRVRLWLEFVLDDLVDPLVFGQFRKLLPLLILEVELLSLCRHVGDHELVRARSTVL